MLKFKNNIVHGAIFDMDGTMFDTERLRFQTLKQASQELIGVEFSDVYLMQCLGLSAKSAEQLAQAEYSADIPYREIRQRADELELESVRNFGVPIKKGLLQVLERLRKSGLRMAVATSSRRAIAEEYLINANVYKFFDVLVCGDEVQQGKPHPEIFITAAQKINLEPSECFMLEDSENGIKSAHAAGGITILFRDIKKPNANMLSLTQHYYASMQAYLDDLNQVIPVLEMPSLQETFPQTLNQLSVGIHGFGAIGGGYLAQILSHWDGYTRPKRIYASTRNTLYRSAVNAFGTYSIRYGQCSYDERIENMHIIDAENLQQMQQMYVESSLIALCLPEHALQQEAKVIAQGLYARFIAQFELHQPLTILVILNKVGAKQLLMTHIHQALETLLDPDTAAKIMAQHYFCDTVVNRMVSKLSDQNLYRQLRIKYNIFKQFQLDDEAEPIEIEDNTRLQPEQERQATLYVEDLRRNFQPSHILQSMDLILFHAESDMPIYVENASPLLQHMRQMILVDDIAEIQLIKNRLWNGVHAMMAWLSSLIGHNSIGVAMADPLVADFTRAVSAQVALGLAAQLPHRQQNLKHLAQSFLDSCEHAYKDPCQRVARDPLRKLSANERVMGALIYHLQHDLAANYVQKGVVLGYLYAIKMQQLGAQAALQHLSKQLQNAPICEQTRQQLQYTISHQLQQLLAGQVRLEAFIQDDTQVAAVI